LKPEGAFSNRWAPDLLALLYRLALLSSPPMPMRRSLSVREATVRNPRTGTITRLGLPRRRSKDDELMRTPSSQYDQLRVSGFPPVRLGSWHRYRSLSQEFDDVFRAEASSIAREPAVRPRDPLTELLSYCS
jgi:hypothetical protein